jgi:hypothetical protein
MPGRPTTLRDVEIDKRADLSAAAVGFEPEIGEERLVFARASSGVQKSRKALT